MREALNSVDAALLFLAGAATAAFVLLNDERRRAVLWTVRCHRGRRCANVTFDGFEGESYPPSGSLVTFDYRCAGCGTNYRLSVLVGEAGDHTVADRHIIASAAPPAPMSVSIAEPEDDA